MNTSSRHISRRWWHLATLLAALLLPHAVWSQTDYSGVYYIASYYRNLENNATTPYDPDDLANNLYLCPTEPNNTWNWYYGNPNTAVNNNTGNFFMTTYKCHDGSYTIQNAVWIVEKHPSQDYYYIKRAVDNTYLTYNGSITSPSRVGANRMRIHTESATPDPDDPSHDIYLFAITAYGSEGAVNISAKSVINASVKYLNINKGNRNSLIGDGNVEGGIALGGIVGLWSDQTSFSAWYLEDARCATPTISFNNATGEVTIETTTAGATIYYTTDNSIPDPANVGGINPTQQYDPSDKPTISTEKTIKAIAVEASHVNSLLASLSITQVATPAVEDNGENSIILTCETEGATIYYTIDPSEETATEYTPGTLLREGFSNRTIRMIAKKSGLINSAIGTGSVKLKCDPPIINQEEGKTFTLTATFPLSGVMKYSINDEYGTYSPYGGSAVSFSNYGDVVYAKTTHADYYESDVTSLEMVKDLEGEGTAESPYLITSQAEFVLFVSWIKNKAAKRSAYYELQTDVSGASAITQPFSGTFDGAGYTITGLTHSLFNTVNGGTVKNLMLDNVSISGGTNVGAICNEATGDSRIYNCGVLATNSRVEKDDDGYDHISSCSSTISGSGYVGGLVGLLDGSSRVINCFSYANITGGSYRGGIVGKNNVAYDPSDYKTMVMNCMFYGDITTTGSPTQIAPIYGGEIITNDGDNNGVNNFNYFRLEASYIQNTAVTKTYNCALGAETRFLQRFEFFRHILNSNRELAAWWITGNRADTAQVMKWVLEPNQIGSTTPYPILKKWGKYPSVVNYTPSDIAYDGTEANRNKGHKLTTMGGSGDKAGTLTVTIRKGSGGAVYEPPVGASITTSPINLPITDKDTAHFNFNYGKVQLPYYNEVGSHNYRKHSDGTSRVVTGWKIVSITGGTEGSYSTGEDVTYDGSGNLTATPYNFADRNCTDKDLYSVSGRVFNQGAYWDVPYGVTAITIEPYWAKCVYLADANADIVYNTTMTTGYAVPNVGGGQIYTNRNSYPIAGESQKVFTDKGDAIATSNSGLFHEVTGTPSSQTVYDYAVVLVGNYHFYNTLDADKSKPYTVTSVDLDGDNEPDYSYILRFDGRNKVHPVRVDFINIPGLGMAQKSTGGEGSYNFGIMQPNGWFESTNTSLFRVTQFEYDNTNRVASPYILQGGVMEQWVNGQNAGHANLTTYFHVGGNVWFKEFHRGTHQDAQFDANHSPVSVTGGDFDQFHLTGLYRADVDICDDNAECYITGGRFRVMAGTGMDGLGTSDGKGNITWIIDNADIKEFYAGSFNAANPAIGNLHTIVNGGHIDFFYGGPKFGDMSSGKTVTTTATGTTFGTFFGAGYGGSSYSRQAPYNHNNIVNFPHSTSQAGNHTSWNNWLSKNYKQTYSSTYGGVSTQFNYQFLPMSGNADNVARIFVEYVNFSLATAHTVTSTLTGCTVLGNFYGGGSLGKVDGTVTSILDDCTVYGNVFGAGFSASVPTVEVDSIDGFRVEPYYYSDLGTYRTGVKGSTTTYTWAQTAADHRIEDAADDAAKTALAIDQEHHILYTDKDLSKSNLGSVNTATLTLKGNTTVGTLLNNGSLKANTGNVYGGGDESTVSGDTQVILKDGATVLGNVYGGGNNGPVGGNSSVTIQE